MGESTREVDRNGLDSAIVLCWPKTLIRLAISRAEPITQKGYWCRLLCYPRTCFSGQDREGTAMSSRDQREVYVRIVELPRTRTVRSGDGDLDAFGKWWGAIPAQDYSILYPRDF